MTIELTDTEATMLYNCFYLHGKDDEFSINRQEKLYGKKAKLEKLVLEIKELEATENKIQSGEFIATILNKLKGKL